MKKIIYLITAVCAVSTASMGQAYTGFYLIGSTPLNEFRDNRYRDGIGFSWEFMSNDLLRNSAKGVDFRLGGGLDFLSCNSVKNSVLLNTPNADPGSLRVKNTHVGLVGIARFTFAPEQQFSPYIDLFAGGRSFSSYQLIKSDKEIPEFEKESRKSIVEKGAFHYGVSGGVLYNVNDWLSVDARLSYSVGGVASFVPLHTVRKDGNEVKYDTRASKTDMLIFRLGVIFRLHDLQRTDNDSHQDNTPVIRKKTTYTSPSVQPAPKKGLDTRPNPPKKIEN